MGLSDFLLEAAAQLAVLNPAKLQGCANASSKANPPGGAQVAHDSGTRQWHTRSSTVKALQHSWNSSSSARMPNLTDPHVELKPSAETPLQAAQK